MSGPQFFHTQSFSRKANPAGQSVQQVIDELRRREEFATHVENPLPPVLLFGLDVEALKSAHDVMIENGKTTVAMADGKTRTRAIRNDRHTLWTVVASYPVPREAIETDTTGNERNLFERWKELNIAYLQDKYGEHLKSVFEHVDETFGHIHAYILPECFEDLNARSFNPAYQAKMAAEKEAEEDGAPPRLKVKLGNQAYRERATEMADEYYKKVGQPAGLTREGPKRRRLSRSEWRKEKSNARAASRLALKTAEDTMREELEPFREALEAVRAHQVLVAKRSAAAARGAHLLEASQIVSDLGNSPRDRFAAAFAVLHSASGELGDLAREIWIETLPNIDPPQDIRSMKGLLTELSSTDFFALSDAIEDRETIAHSIETTKTVLQHIASCLREGLKWSLRNLREFGRAAADIVNNCIESLASTLAGEEAIRQDDLVIPDTAATFLELPEDAQKAVERAFPKNGGTQPS
jgi:hypothetical protein